MYARAGLSSAPSTTIMVMLYLLGAVLLRREQIVDVVLREKGAKFLILRIRKIA